MSSEVLDIIAGDNIASIIPKMLFGLMLIILWLPVIVFTEKNNKGNDEEYALLLDKINKNLKLIDVTNKVEYKDVDLSLINASNVTTSTTSNISDTT